MYAEKVVFHSLVKGKDNVVENKAHKLGYINWWRSTYPRTMDGNSKDYNYKLFGPKTQPYLQEIDDAVPVLSAAYEVFELRLGSYMDVLESMFGVNREITTEMTRNIIPDCLEKSVLLPSPEYMVLDLGNIVENPEEAAAAIEMVSGS